MIKDALSVVGLPGLAGVPSGVLLVEADEEVGQLTADRLAVQQLGQIGEIDQPVGIPTCPVVIGAIHDPEDEMMSLGCFMQEAACLVESVCHGASTARRTKLGTRVNFRFASAIYPRQAQSHTRVFQRSCSL